MNTRCRADGGPTRPRSSRPKSGRGRQTPASSRAPGRHSVNTRCRADRGPTRHRSSRRKSGRGRRTPTSSRAPRRDGLRSLVVAKSTARRRWSRGRATRSGARSPHRDRHGQAKAADGVSRTGPRGARAGGARARRVFGYRRGGEVPRPDDARTRRRSSESLARRATEGAAALLRGSATPPAASTGPCRRVASGLGTSLAPRPLTHRAGHGDHGGGRGWGPRDHRSRPGRRLQPTSWASFGAKAEHSARAECEPERGPAGPVPSPRGGRAAGVDEQQADE